MDQLAVIISKFSRNWLNIRRGLVALLVLVAIWVVFGQHSKPVTAPKLAPVTKATDGGLKVVPSDANSSPLNLQQTTNPVDNPSGSVQSGQSDLQPAQNSSQLPSGL